MSIQPGESPMPMIHDLRVRYAAERTLLAWIRTGVALMAFGFVVARFGWFLREFGTRPQEVSRGPSVSVIVGIGLIVLGVIANFLAGRDHAKFLYHFDRGEVYRPPARTPGLVMAWLLVAVGLGLATYLAFLAH